MMLRRLFILLSLFALICPDSQSQSTNTNEIYAPALAIKFSPLPLIDYTPAIQGGIEMSTFNNQTAQIEYGFITGSLREENFEGFKLKGEYRFYNKLTNESRESIFWGLQHMYKQVTTPRTEAVWRNNFTYQQIYSYNVRNETNSTFLTGGIVFPFAGPVFLETAMGLGYRRLAIRHDGLPEDVDLDFFGNRSFLGPSRPGVYFMPGVFFSLKFVWVVL